MGRFRKEIMTIQKTVEKKSKVTTNSTTSKLETKELILPPDMLELRGRLKCMTKADLEFCLAHLMRKYFRDPLTFDMTLESRALVEGHDNGILPSQQNVMSRKRQDWNFLLSMQEQGFWLATPPARHLIVRTAFNNSYKTGEILKSIEAEVEGCKMDPVNSRSIVITTLKLAGFKKKFKYRKELSRGVSVWDYPEEDTNLDTIVAELETNIAKEIEHWRV